MLNFREQVLSTKEIEKNVAELPEDIAEKV